MLLDAYSFNSINVNIVIMMIFNTPPWSASSVSSIDNDIVNRLFLHFAQRTGCLPIFYFTTDYPLPTFFSLPSISYRLLSRDEHSNMGPVAMPRNHGQCGQQPLTGHNWHPSASSRQQQPIQHLAEWTTPSHAQQRCRTRNWMIFNQAENRPMSKQSQHNEPNGCACVR